MPPEPAPAPAPQYLGIPVSANKKRWWLMLAGVLVLIVVAAGIYWFFFRTGTNSALESAQLATLAQAEEAILSGDATSTVSVLEGIAKDPASATVAARANLDLGGAYIVTDQSIKGVQLLKQVSLNSSYPAHSRAIAVEKVISYFYTHGSRQLTAENLIFTGPRWSSFLEGVPPGTIGYARAARNALTWAEGFSPLSNIEYRLAQWYTSRLYLYTPDSSSYTTYVDRAQMYLKRGDAQYALETKGGSLAPAEQYILGIALELKARALADLYEQKQGDVTVSAVTDAFTQALDFLSKESSALATQETASTNFYLAAFLEHVDSTKYASDISTKLATLYVPDTSTTTPLMNMLADYGGNKSLQQTPQGMDIIALAKTDPQFKALLVSLGWKGTVLK